jgi:aspartyl-tRNA(Asn)/glutamyl-tRNA(Gln) amidotransferase subunit B
MSLSDFEVVIGLECHAELLTASKMFCGCANQPGAAPNTNVCPVCLGLPGALPVINERAVQLTALTGLALNCQISEFTRFDRKNYFYPDLMKGYQISQYQHPICHDGWLEIDPDGTRQRVGVRRVHLEEDTAKSFHAADPGSGAPSTLIDVNRSGVPLIEIVSEPDLHSAEQARQYLQAVRDVVVWLGVSTGNMEEGAFRCDANVSVRPAGTTELGTKVEIKNMNSFRAVFRALAYEAERQVAAIERGEKIVQETRGWDEARGVTVGQRTKEHADDYRYFPEPDLPPLALTPAWVDHLRASLPELPEQRRQRFVEQFVLSRYDAELLTSSRATADYFEDAVGRLSQPKAIANWMTGELFRLLNAEGVEIGQSKLTPARLVELIELIDQGTISGRIGKEVFEETFRTGAAPREIVEKRGLGQISDTGALERLVDEAIAANPKSVADYRAGKAQALGFLVGQVMKSSRGKANPATVNELLRDRLGGAG